MLTAVPMLFVPETLIPVSPSPTPSVTPSLTPSNTPPVTPSLTPTLTPTVTPSISVSVTPTHTVTPTVTPSITVSVTPSHSPPVTPSVTPTPSPNPIIVTITPSSVSGTCYNLVGCTATTTNTVYVFSVTGGSGTYTGYQWYCDNGSITINSPTSTATYLHAALTCSGSSSQTGNVWCVVTDSLGATGQSGNSTVTLSDTGCA